MEKIILIIYFLSLCVLFGFGIHGLILVYFYNKTKKNIIKKPPLQKDLPIVTIQLPMYNEYFVVERIIGAACGIKYPIDKLEIQVLDDSTDDSYDLAKKTVERYKKQGYNIKHIHRVDRSGYKAGALKAGLEVAEGEFVAIFDADFVPDENFLLDTIPYFQDPKVGLVQTRWEHLNEDFSMLTKAQALALDAHFCIEQQVRCKAGFFFSFNGTAGIWRKATIFDAGNWQADTLTEDLDLSYRSQLKGWKFLYLNDITSPAELPEDINSLKIQQFRWTKGAVETAIKLIPKVVKAKLPFKVKLECYAHLTSNIVFPFILLTALLNVPVVLIKNSIDGVDTFYNAMSIFVFATIATFIFYLHGQRAIHLDWRRRLLMFPVFMAGSMGMAVNNTKAIFEAIIGKKTAFIRTPKTGDAQDSSLQRKKYKNHKISGIVIIEILLALYFVAGIILSIYYSELAAIPFQLMFLLGFGAIGFLSLRHAILTVKKTKS
ncbi:MAG: cellulose synthase family protein [Candidatus Kapaibacterium sp.]|jgi:cellulose synthase/poly-beta-1,6-N-acetylglucosamine synthase-like glycosyltransferase